MKSFDQWLIDTTARPQTEDGEKLLPEGVVEAGPNRYEAKCCACGEWREIYCDLEEIPEVGYEHYCGGSPHCCP